MENWKTTRNVTLINIIDTFIAVVKTHPLHRYYFYNRDLHSIHKREFDLSNYIEDSKMVRKIIDLKENMEELKLENEHIEDKVLKMDSVKSNLIESFSNIVIRSLPGSDMKSILNFLVPEYMFEELEAEAIKGTHGRIYFYINKHTKERYVIKSDKLTTPIKERNHQIKNAKSEFITMLHCLHSDYVIRPISLGINEEHIGIMMEDGGISLDKFCFNQEHLVDERSFLVAYLDLAMGLRFFTSQNIYHGDVKPQNILVKEIANPNKIVVRKINDTQSRVDLTKTLDPKTLEIESKFHRTHQFRYIDFGAAITFDNTQQFVQTMKTKSATEKIKELTLGYMAPEIIWPMLARHYNYIDIKYNKIDIYSLALTMYSVIMQQYITHEEVQMKGNLHNYPSFLKTLENNMNQRLEKMNYIEKEQIVDIIMRCLDENPRNRSTISEVINSIVQLLKKITVF